MEDLIKLICDSFRVFYKDDGKATIYLNDSQKENISKVKKKIESGEYILKKNECLCKNNLNKKDIEIAQKDRYGFSIKTLICGSCGLVRCDKVFDKKSLTNFYINEYRLIYTIPNNSAEQLFNIQKINSKKFYSFLSKHINMNDRLKVFDIGCGAGGIMYEFMKNGYSCTGFDYNEEYMKYGLSQGLLIKNGSLIEKGYKEQCNLVILSHVMEHFLNPITEMKNIIELVETNGYLLIEVPGIIDALNTSTKPIAYLQNAHIFSYYKDFLTVFFESLGLKVIYGDETALFLLQKIHCITDNESIIFSNNLSVYPEKIKMLFCCSYLKNYFFITKSRWKELVISIFEIIGIKEIIKKLFIILRIKY